MDLNIDFWTEFYATRLFLMSGRVRMYPRALELWLQLCVYCGNAACIVGGLGGLRVELRTKNAFYGRDA